MGKIIRVLLLKILGLKNYLSLVSDIYIRLIRSGFMKKKYPELFFLKQLVKPGFVCVDIGANVGYYSVFLSQLSTKNGRVHAVEPVGLFAGIFKQNAKKFGLENITLHQIALGASNKKIKMGTPVIDGVFRHGLTKVLNENSPENLYSYDVEMKIPDELFSSLERLDFLKCDVEGYEVVLFPHFMSILSKFKPIIQMEISSEENRRQIFDLLFPLGYSGLRLNENKLEKMPVEDALKYEGGDFYFSAT
ncbi:MAG: FkbM family methyltransferase [Bacteroidia bacterium]